MLTWHTRGELPADTCPCPLLSMAPKILEQTLSPLWDELLVFDQLIVDGRREHLQEEPPLVVVSVFDHNKLVSACGPTWVPGLPPASWCPSSEHLLFSSPCPTPQGPPVFLGRALAAPRVKLVEEPYQRPELQFFPLRKGPRAAGELIATFELIELDYSGRLEVRVPRPTWHRLWAYLVIHLAPGNTKHGCNPSGWGG